MTTNMNAIIRRAAGITDPSRRHAHTGDDDLGEHLTPDHDQGQRSSPVRPPPSAQINDRIRRAAGISIRPGQRSVPEIGDHD